MPTPPQSIRPTPLSEKTFAGAAVGFCVNVIIFAGFLAFKTWPATNAVDVIRYLGIALIILALGNLLIVIGLMSPWIGTVKMTGLGVDLDINGTSDLPTPPPSDK